MQGGCSLGNEPMIIVSHSQELPQLSDGCGVQEVLDGTHFL